MMQVTHTFQVQGICPVDNSIDRYEVEVIINYRMEDMHPPLQVEAIVSCCQKLLETPCYQENFTQRLAELLLAKVTTRCLHSAGVHTTCIYSVSEFEGA